MAVIEVVTDTSWYENFSDASIGATVPTGWTKYGSPAIAVVADTTAYGGKVVKITNTSPSALGMNIAGTPENVEILARVMATNEIVNPTFPPYWGGPGGRIHLDGSDPNGVGVGATNLKSYNIETFFSRLSRDNPLWEPPYPYHYAQFSGILTRTHGGNAVHGDLRTGRAWAVSGETATEFNDRIWRKLMMSQDYQLNNYTQTQYDADVAAGPAKGDVAKYWSFMRFRINALNGVAPASRVRYKWWKSGTDEPTHWLQDFEVINLYWPSSGAAGFFSNGSAYNGIDATYTSLDYISISIDPENVEAPSPPAPTILNNCPLDNGYIGVSYSVQLETDV